MDYEGFDWKSPDYDRVFMQRIETLRRIRAQGQTFIDHMLLYYREHPWDMIHDWGVTYDPRNLDMGLPAYLPFVLFPKQIEFCKYIIRKWRAREPGLIEKSRDVGATWLSGSLAAAICLTHEGAAIGFGSRVIDLVDKIGTMKPILPKIRVFLENLPHEFRGGWDAARHAPYMRILFPRTGSFIGGEGGDQIGRGDRTSLYFVDEAQPLAANVMTPFGPRTMESINPGDEVLGVDGKSTRVIAINDCGVHEVFRVVFSDGTYAECSPNHLWIVDEVIGVRWRRTLRTHQLVDNFRYESPEGQVQYRYRVPVCAPVQYAHVGKLPLDPYLVGALLGDGSTKAGTVRITTADREIVDEFRRLLPVGVVIGAFDGRCSYNVVDALGRQGRGLGGIYIKSKARSLVASCGIRGLGAETKFIPEIYKFASPRERLSLLQGLMDTDGSATGGAASYYTVSRRLADDVRFVVQSLGGTATLNIKPDARGYKSTYAVHLALPEGMKPFRLTRKLRSLKRRKHPFHRTIVAIEMTEPRPVKCITVANEDGLYLTDHFIVTHNSAHLERPDLVEASLSETTRCRIDMSTPAGMGNSFARKRWEGRVEPFIFDWRDDPRKDDAWYAKRCGELDPIVVAQEIDRDYSASVEGVVIAGAWVRSAIGAAAKLGIEPSGEKLAALDIADEGRDKNALAAGKGIEISFIDEWTGKGSDIFGTVEKAIDICDLIAVRKLRYDADGPGAGVRGDARVINERRASRAMRPVVAESFRGSEGPVDPDSPFLSDPKGMGTVRTNKDLFLNRKAQAWWALRRRFELTHRWITKGEKCNPDEIISLKPDLPLLMRLTAELSQATYKETGVGKLQINKTPPGMKSPNLADAVMMRFAPNGPKPLLITNRVLAEMGARMF